MKRFIAGLRFRVRNFIGSNLWIFLFISKFLKNDLLIKKKTKLVIEGFPRSGNTFCVLAFVTAQKENMHIAHHIHLAAQVIQGIRMRLPVMVLIREPDEALKSFLVRYPKIKTRDAINAYCRFYHSLLPYKKHLMVVPFKNLIENIDLVIKEFNKKFGTRFEVFNHSEDNKASIFEKIKQLDFKSGNKTIEFLSIPALEKEKKKEHISFSSNPVMMKKAKEIYQVFING